MIKILAEYTSSYFDEIFESTCYVGNSLLLECEEKENIQSIDNWFRTVYYKNTELIRFSCSIKDVTDIYEEFIKTNKIDLKYNDLLKQLNGHKRYITIKQDNWMKELLQDEKSKEVLKEFIHQYI